MAEALQQNGGYDPDIQMTTNDGWDELADRLRGEDGKTPAERRQEIELVKGGASEQEANQEEDSWGTEEALGAVAVNAAREGNNVYEQPEHNPFAMGVKPESQTERAEVEDEPVVEVEAASVYETPRYNPFELGINRAESREDKSEEARDESYERTKQMLGGILKNRNVKEAIQDYDDGIAMLKDELDQMRNRNHYQTNPEMRDHGLRQIAEAEGELQSMERKREILLAVDNNDIDSAKAAMAVEMGAEDSAPGNGNSIAPVAENAMVSSESEPAAMTQERILLSSAEITADALHNPAILEGMKDVIAQRKAEAKNLGKNFVTADMISAEEWKNEYGDEFTPKGEVIDVDLNELAEKTEFAGLSFELTQEQQALVEEALAEAGKNLKENDPAIVDLTDPALGLTPAQLAELGPIVAKRAANMYGRMAEVFRLPDSKPNNVVDMDGDLGAQIGAIVEERVNAAGEASQGSIENEVEDIEDLTDPEKKKGLIAKLREKLSHNLKLKNFAQALKKKVAATIMALTLVNNGAAITAGGADAIQKPDNELMAAMNGPSVVMEVDQTSDDQVGDALIAESDAQGGTFAENVETIVDSTIERMPNGLKYNFDSYDQSKAWAIEHGDSHLNNFATDQTHVYDDRDEALNAMTDIYSKEPQALAAFASQAPSILEKAGLSGKTYDELSEMLVGENGGEIQDKLLDALNSELSNPKLGVEFVHAAKQKVQSFYMKKIDQDAPSTPDNIQLKVWDMERDGDLQMVLTLEDGTKVTVNLKCGFQPDIRIDTATPDDDDGDGSSTSEDHPTTTTEEDDTPDEEEDDAPVEEEDTPDEEEDDEDEPEEEDTPDTPDTPDAPDDDEEPEPTTTTTTEPTTTTTPEPTTTTTPEPTTTTTPEPTTTTTPPPDEPTITTTPPPENPTPSDDVTPKDGNNLVDNQSQETGDSEVDKETEVAPSVVENDENNVDIKEPTEEEANQQDVAADATKTPEEQAQDLEKQVMADAAEKTDDTTNADVESALNNEWV